MSQSPDDEQKAVDQFFENLGDPEQFDLDQLLDGCIEFTGNRSN